MKNIYHILFCLFAVCSLSAQDAGVAKPDYEQIEKQVKDKTSPYYYETLLEKYNKADTNMTLEEKRHLYYGYSFQNEYSPYHKSGTIKALNALLELDDPNKIQVEQILVLSGDILKEYPFSIRIKQHRMYYLRQLNRGHEAMKEDIQCEMIIDAILSTGDGTSSKQPIYVISPVNEYELIGLMGFKYGGEQSLMGGRYDYITLANNAYRLPGFYFDVSRSIDTLKF
jgi:hypothetical protein